MGDHPHRFPSSQQPEESTWSDPLAYPDGPLIGNDGWIAADDYGPETLTVQTDAVYNASLVDDNGAAQVPAAIPWLDVPAPFTISFQAKFHAQGTAAEAIHLSLGTYASPNIDINFQDAGTTPGDYDISLGIDGVGSRTFLSGGIAPDVWLDIVFTTTTDAWQCTVDGVLKASGPRDPGSTIGPGAVILIVFNTASTQFAQVRNLAISQP